MIIDESIVQGSEDWLSDKKFSFGASECAAMLGLSRNVKRTELLHQKFTMMPKEFSEWVQKNILDKGHEVESLARPIAEEIIGASLYPVFCRDSVNPRIVCSTDGLTLNKKIGWENKQYNAEYFAMVESGEMPEEHMPQVQQSLMITKADKWLFMISDGTVENTAYMWVFPDMAWFDRIRAGWNQFEIDLANYVPVEIAERPRAEVSIELPALFVTAHGAIVDSNMAEYGRALSSKLAEVRSIQLVTDQDFSNAKEAAKKFRDQIKKLELAKEAMLAQTMTVGDAARMIDAWSEDLRVTALQLEKDVEREDKNKKESMILKARAEFTEHVAAIESEIKPIRLNASCPDFALAIKGKSKYASMQDSINTALANGKIQADTTAKDYREKLAWCKENAEGMAFLFPDLQQIIVKPIDDFALLISSRIKTHKDAESERIRAAEEAERKRCFDELAQATDYREAEKRKPSIDQCLVDKSPVLQDSPVDKSTELQEKKKRPSATEIVRVLMNAFDATESEVGEWIHDLDFSFII